MKSNVETGDDFEPSIDDSRWIMETGSLSKSIELESWSYIQHKDYQLQILHKKETQSLRNPILMTTIQRLAFFSAYITLTYKSEIVTTSQIDFSVYIATVTIDMIMKNLPQYFVIMFLSCYSSEEHLYVSKMVPLFWGFNLQIILSSLFSLNFGMDAAELQWYLVLDGFISQLPWTRCHGNKTIKCFDYHVFKQKVLLPTTKLIYVSFKTFETVNNRTISYNFGNSFMEYFGNLRHHNIISTKDLLTLLIRFSLFLLCVLSGFTFFKKWFWKVMSVAYWTINCIYLFCLLYVLLKYFEDGVPHIKRTITYIPHEIIDAAFPSIGLSITAPPILHVLFARSVHPVDAGWDSGVLVSYCFIYVVFRATVDFCVKLNVEADIGFAYNLPHYNMYSSFFFYPLFFSFLPMGDFITMTFLCARAFLELMLLAATFQCLVEVLYCEWPWRFKKFRVRKWIISIIISVIILGLYFVTPFYARMYLYGVSQVLSCLLEILIITLFYPIGRLMDDITFHHGSPPAKLRFYTLLIFPVYYTFKSYKILRSLITFPSMDFYKLQSFKTLQSQLGSFIHIYWLISIIPLALGFVYAIVKHVFINKKKCSSLLRPRPTWGPRDHVTRQLRKQYDSRDYIPSHASRYLARHMLAKAEAATYRLDIRYESAAEHKQSIVKDSFKMEQENK